MSGGGSTYQYSVVGPSKESFDKSLQFLKGGVAEATQTTQSGLDNALQSLAGQFDISQETLAPYLSTAQAANQRLASSLGLGGESPEQINNLLRGSPGYQFQFDEGQRAIQNSAAAGGRLKSGSVGKELAQFGQGLASNYFANYQQQLAQLGSPALALNSAQLSAQRGQIASGLQAGTGQFLGNLQAESGAAAGAAQLQVDPDVRRFKTSRGPGLLGSLGGILGGVGSLAGLFI